MNTIRLFAIGGQPVTVNYLRLLNLACKGKENYTPHIVVIAHAAKNPVEDGALSAADFISLGARVTVLSPGSHKKLPNDIDAIYMRGGVQTRLMDGLQADGLVSAIRRAASQGILIAGNSAGTAALSDRMVAGGMSEETLISCNQLEYADGLALLNKIMLDTHVDRYHRHTRLLALCAENPGRIVIGIDEGTAALFVDKGDGQWSLEVSGTNHVTIVNQGKSFWTNIQDSCQLNDGGKAIGSLEINILSAGNKASITKRGNQVSFHKQ